MYSTKNNCSNKTAKTNRPLYAYIVGRLKAIKENVTSKVFVNSDKPSSTNKPAARPLPVVSSKNK